MTTIMRTQAVWSGFLGGPGYTNFYHDGAATSVDAIHTFFDAIKMVLVNGTSVVIPDDGESFNDATGELVGNWGVNTVRAVNSGSDSAFYSGASGAVINWKTAGINRGRKIKGRTFLVPLIGAAFDTTGTLNNGIRSTLAAAAAGLVANSAGHILVWSRPRLKLGGLAVPITSSNVPDLAAVLRSRRGR